MPKENRRPSERKPTSFADALDAMEKGRRPAATKKKRARKDLDLDFIS